MFSWDNEVVPKTYIKLTFHKNIPIQTTKRYHYFNFRDLARRFNSPFDSHQSQSKHRCRYVDIVTSFKDFRLFHRIIAAK